MQLSQREGHAEHLFQPLRAGRFGVERGATDVFFHKAGLLLVRIIQKAFFCIDIKKVWVIYGAVLGGGF